MSTSVFGYGDWVVYDKGYAKEVGRVTEVLADSAFVCYTSGCTAASTPLRYLRLATEREVADMATPGIGHHRFDDACPDYDPECCSVCANRLGVANG